VEAVIDKDLASACLGSSVKAHVLILLTSVPQVFINFATPNQAPLSKISLKAINQYYQQGHFPPGSMGPKIQAAIQFIESNSKGKVIITDFKTLKRALKGKAGTIITKN
ncbi:MAG TPA: carbamate kinase, partial [Candidatus Nanoarchaeia archaeon]|nr:carbamate kinase [Candidatus Nanoarchaeia archaeon]